MAVHGFSIGNEILNEITWVIYKSKSSIHCRYINYSERISLE